MTAEYIDNTTARGCFLVLPPEDGSPDVFRTVNNVEHGVIVSGVPPGTYNTALVYDLEENGLPNEKLAYRHRGDAMVVRGMDIFDVCSAKYTNILLQVKMMNQHQRL